VTNSTTTLRVSQPLGPRPFLFILAVIAIGLVGADIALNGPLTWAAAQRFLVAPAEQEWGFHAEWKAYGSSAHSDSLLTVVRVTDGGAFDRAGIKPGYAFAPRHSATFGPHFGGPYGVFSGDPKTLRLQMLETPTEQWREHTYELSR